MILGSETKVLDFIRIKCKMNKVEKKFFFLEKVKEFFSNRSHTNFQHVLLVLMLKIRNFIFQKQYF